MEIFKKPAAQAIAIFFLVSLPLIFGSILERGYSEKPQSTFSQLIK